MACKVVLKGWWGSAVKVGVLGTNLRNFRSHDGRAVALVGVSSVVVVVLLLSDQEVERLLNGGDNGVVVHVAHVGDHGLGRGSLFIGKRHDAGPVLRADIVALPVELGRVVDGEEDLEEGFVGDDAWVKLNFHHFSVAGGAAADCLVGGVGVVAACVSGERRLDAVNLFVSAFNAPKASSAHNHAFHASAPAHLPFEGLICIIASTSLERDPLQCCVEPH